MCDSCSCSSNDGNISQSELQEIEEKKQSQVQERYNLSLKVNCRKAVVDEKYADQTRIVKVSSHIDDAHLIPYKNAAELPKRLHRANIKTDTNKVNFI